MMKPLASSIALNITSGIYFYRHMSLVCLMCLLKGYEEEICSNVFTIIITIIIILSHYMYYCVLIPVQCMLRYLVNHSFYVFLLA
jgi:hypothetical protein